MKLLTEIRNSIYNPIYYRVVRSEATKSSLGYYYRFILTLSVILTILFAIVFVPLLTTFSSLVKDHALDWYPADLQVTINNGEATTNVTEPYLIPIPVSWRSQLNQSNDPNLTKWDNLLVIDTKNQFDLKKFEDYKAPVWLSKNSLIYYRNTGVMIEPLSRFGNITINHDSLNHWLGMVSPFITTLAPLLVLLFFIFLIIVFSLYLVFLLLVALLVMLVGRLKQIKLAYGESYRVAVHASTLPLLLHVIVPFVNLHFLPTIILLVIAAINLKTEDELLVSA